MNGLLPDAKTQPPPLRRQIPQPQQNAITRSHSCVFLLCTELNVGFTLSSQWEFSEVRCCIGRSSPLFSLATSAPPAISSPPAPARSLSLPSLPLFTARLHAEPVALQRGQSAFTTILPIQFIFFRHHAQCTPAYLRTN